MTAALNHRELYRLPWSLPDNANAWLEPTMKCNLACEACYRANVDQHRSLEQVAEDPDVVARYCNTDVAPTNSLAPVRHPSESRAPVLLTRMFGPRACDAAYERLAVNR
jgi:hypothetical protein